MLRYGSLTDFSRIVMNPTDIGKRLLIGRETVAHMLWRFTSRGYSFDNLTKRRERFACIPRAV